MSDINRREEERDEVLFAFHQAYERPAASDIIAWCKRYPAFAEDIRAHATVSRDWAANAGEQPEEADERLQARAFSNALNILYAAEAQAARASEADAPKSFHEMLGACGKEIYVLARDLNIARGVLADLVNGWMCGPLSQRLVTAVMAALGITRGAFDDAHRYSLNHPTLDHAKADRAPSVTARACATIIRESNMSEERKRYWLDEG